MLVEKLEKVLVITSCSKKKRSYKTTASDMYQGQLFKMVKKFAKTNNFDFKILSAKYGLLNPDEIIKPYDKKLKNNEDIKILQKDLIFKWNNLSVPYDFVLLIMGKYYRGVFEVLDQEKIIYFRSYNGIGGLLKIMKKFLKTRKETILKLIKMKYNERRIIFQDVDKDFAFEKKFFKKIS